MLIDYLPLLLTNMSAALIMVGLYYLYGVASGNPKAFAAGFAMTGLVAMVGGLYMSLTWPLRTMGTSDVRWANFAFGDPTALLGVLLLGAALAIAKGWSMAPVGIFAALAGAAAIVIGAALYANHLSQKPELAAAGFILAGLGGVLAPPILLMPRLKIIRLIGAAAVLASAAIWLLTALMSYWMHLSPGFLSHLTLS